MARGVEVVMHTCRLLDLTPKRRDEAWVRDYDRYGPACANKR